MNQASLVGRLIALIIDWIALFVIGGLASALFGDEGLTLALAFYAVASVVQLTIGFLIAAGEWKPVL